MNSCEYWSKKLKGESTSEAVRNAVIISAIMFILILLSNYIFVTISVNMIVDARMGEMVVRTQEILNLLQLESGMRHDADSAIVESMIHTQNAIIHSDSNAIWLKQYIEGL